MAPHGSSGVLTKEKAARCGLFVLRGGDRPPRAGYGWLCLAPYGCGGEEAPASQVSTNAHHPDDWLSRREAALYSSLSLATIDRAIKAGKLKAKRVEGRVLIRRRWLDAYLLLTLTWVLRLAVILLVLLGLLSVACIVGLHPEGTIPIAHWSLRTYCHVPGHHHHLHHLAILALLPRRGP